MNERMRAVLMSVPQSACERLTEIRIRSGRAVSLVYPDRIRYLNEAGNLADNPGAACVTVTAEEINSIVNALCRYSVHSCARELREGYFMLENGVRVGVAGTASGTDERTLRDISSLNFRISRCVTGCAEAVAERVGLDSGVLICGGVNSGKTTVLRDLCRFFGGRRKCVLIDERNEISATVAGTATYDVGLNTDVLVGTSRADGVISSIRTLSPDFVFCDEISTPDDSSAIIQGHGCGVRFAATLHAGSYEDLMCRRVAAELIDAGVFGYAVILAGSHAPGKIAEIRRLTHAS